MSSKEAVEKHRAQSIYYLENAYKFIEAGKPDKASEFLWGSMAQAIKAVAASKGLVLTSHSDLGRYARNLAKELQDNTIYDSFSHAQSLHTNFYECELEIQDVIRGAEEVRAGLTRLLALIPKETVENQGNGQDKN